MPITEILEKLRREQKIRKPSCTPCDKTISDAVIRFKELIDHIDIVREMYKNRIYKMKLKDGITYTIDDIESKINTDKCRIEDNFNRYQTCCKEGKLPEIEKFKC